MPSEEEMRFDERMGDWYIAAWFHCVREMNDTVDDLQKAFGDTGE